MQQSLFPVILCSRSSNSSRKRNITGSLHESQEGFILKKVAASGESIHAFVNRAMDMRLQQ